MQTKQYFESVSVIAVSSIKMGQDKYFYHLKKIGTDLCSQSVLRITSISFKIKGESQFSVLPLTLSFARSRESKGYPNSRFVRGVGLRGSGRYPLKPSIFVSLLETKGYPEHTAQPATMASRESKKIKYFWLK